MVCSETEQAHYVSLTTNALTGTHGISLFVVVIWFIYRLKHETIPVKWTREALSRRKEALMKNIVELYRNKRSRNFQRHVCL